MQATSAQKFKAKFEKLKKGNRMNVHKIAYTRVIALAFAAFIFNYDGIYSPWLC